MASVARMVRVKIYPETPESIARAKEAQETEQADVLARILAAMKGYPELEHEGDHVRQHFAQWALIALRGSALDAEQFRVVVLAHRQAAQCAENISAGIERYEARDLASALNTADNCYWTQIASGVIRHYQTVLGCKNPEAIYGDPRRI